MYFLVCNIQIKQFIKAIGFFSIYTREVLKYTHFVEVIQFFLYCYGHFSLPMFFCYVLRRKNIANINLIQPERKRKKKYS